MRESTPALDAVFKPGLQHPRSVEEIGKRLGMAIRLGLLAPGTRLPPQRDLAVQLGVTRSTVQQALATLSENRHLESHRGGGGGTFVADAPPLSLVAGTTPVGDEARAMLDERLAIEIGATVLAAERATPADLDRLEKAVAAMVAAATFADYRRADVRFHIGVAEAAHSPRLIVAMTEVQGDLTDLLAPIANRNGKRLAGSNAQHRSLIALLRDGDSARALLLMRSHLQHTESLIAGRPGELAGP